VYNNTPDFHTKIRLILTNGLAYESVDYTKKVLSHRATLVAMLLDTNDLTCLG
jgi:hypothetical protein